MNMGKYQQRVGGMKELEQCSQITKQQKLVQHIVQSL